MSQRIMTGVSVAMAACGFIVVGLVWSMMKQSERVNLRLLEQMAILADRPEPAQGGSTADLMSQISFQLEQANKDKKPAVGFTGKLIKSGVQTDSFTVEAVSNESGLLDFGNLPWGHYDLLLTARWGETSQIPTFTVIPGRDFNQTILCPAEAPQTNPVQVQVNWSDLVSSEDWFLICDFRNYALSGDGQIFQLDTYRRYGENQWVEHQSRYPSIPKSLSGSDGVYLVNMKNKICACPLSKDGSFQDIDPDSLRFDESISLLQGDYVLPVMYLLKRKYLKQASELNTTGEYRIITKDRLRSFSFSARNRSLNFENILNDKYNGRHTRSSDSVLLLPFYESDSTSDTEYLFDKIFHIRNLNGVQLSELLRFSVTMDQQNHWEIKLPFQEKAKSEIESHSF